jgi:hypothetical protein
MAPRPLLSETELEAVWSEEIEPWLFADATTAEDPVLVMVGAQPGAGKSHGIGRAEALHPDARFTRVIGDDLRPFHPAYPDLAESPDPELMPAATAEASGWWVRRALAHAAKRRFSVAVEGTFRDPAVPLATAGQFAAAGHRVHVVALAVPEAVSWLACVTRYLLAASGLAGRAGPARWTPRAAHDLAYANAPATLHALWASPSVRRITILRRDGGQALDAERDWTGRWPGRADPVRELLAARADASRHAPEVVAGLALADDLAARLRLGRAVEQGLAHAHRLAETARLG